MKILMVEDMDRYHQLFATEIKDAMAADVQFAVSAEEALEILWADPNAFDIILLDYNLPGKSGEDVLRELRASPEFDTVPIIILTGQSAQDLQSRLFHMGANDFIEKGCAPEVFIARLSAQCRNKLALDRLTELALDREMFAAGVLHDIRNIETSLMAGCEIIEMQLRSKKELKIDRVIEDVQILKEQVKRIDEYANMIISKVRDSQIQVNLCPIEIKKCAEWTDSFISTGHPKPLIRISYDLSAPIAIADEHYLKLCFLNLFQNSIKYARPNILPEITIASAETDKLTTITLTDNGIGVEEPKLRKIFQAFFTEGGSVQNKSYGLGLSMVSKVMQSMGGRVWAECRPDKTPGTVFKLEFKKGTHTF